MTTTVVRPKLKVGDRVFVQNRRRYGQNHHAIVRTVGRKYFTLEMHGHTRFEIETLQSVDECFASDMKVWLSETEYADERDRVELWSSIKRNYFDRYLCPSDLTGDQLRRVAAIF